MSEFDRVLAGDLDDWLETLPRHTQETIHFFLNEGHEPEQVARLWLSSQGPEDTHPFGTGVQPSVFFDKFLEEIEALVCGAERYATDREKLLAEFSSKQTFVVATVASLIAPVVGAAAPVIAPAVALVAFTIGRIGVAAWCEARRETKKSTKTS